MSKLLTILGSTGSIGKQTLDIVRQNRDEYAVFAISAFKNISLLEKQIKEFSPRIVVTDQPTNLKERFPGTTFLVGKNYLREIASASEVDIVVSAIVGIAGLPPTEAAVRAGKRIALANKESMVVAGELLTSIAKRTSAQIIPIDSEHNGIFQLIDGKTRSSITKIILTASGGPFLNTPESEFKNIHIEDALKHPHWNMGAKISVDSATLMNKGLELIEARWLFDLKPEQIEAVIHPQCIVHSIIELSDKQYHAVLANPDMREPIRYSLSWPERKVSVSAKKLDFKNMPPLTFQEPDTARFPVFKLACEVLESDNPAVSIALNASNETAVDAFLNKRLSFQQISILIKSVMENISYPHPSSIDEILTIDNQIRIKSTEAIKTLQAH